MKKENRINFLLPSIVYVVTNIWIFLVHGVFWDDWTLYHANQNAVMHQFIGNGAIWMGYLHNFMLDTFNPILVYHFIIFIIGWLNVLLFHNVLNLTQLPKDFIKYSTLLFAAYPLGYAHMTMICIPYQFGLLMMLISANLYVANKKQFNIYRYILCFVSMFLASAFLTSTIVLFFGLILVVNINEKWDDLSKSLSSVWHTFLFLIFDIVYFVPCILFWILRSLYFLPTGNYAADGYNTITFQNIISYPINLIASIVDTIQYHCYQVHSIVGSLLLFSLFIIIAILLHYVVANLQNDGQRKNNFKYLIIFCFMYIMGITAYLLVGDVQHYNMMEDRHGILLQMVIPSIIFIILNIFINDTKKIKWVLCAIIALFSTFGIRQYFVAIEQVEKNDAIIVFFQNHQLNDGNVRVIDDAIFFDCERFYTYAGLYKEATSKQDKCFAINMGEFYCDSEYLIGAYNQRDAKPGTFTNLMSIKRIEQNFTKYALLNVKHYYSNKDKYRMRLSRMYEITLVDFPKCVD